VSLSKKEVEHILKLARIETSEEKAEVFAKQVSEVLNYIDTLNELDTSNIEETDQVTGLFNNFRSDEIKKEINPSDLLKSTELEISKNQIKVKKVL
jgi:aspartyl-tRNA(Asn)/glutamyl-tRNA(Gln) amidotransferase subunit C